MNETISRLRAAGFRVWSSPDETIVLCHGDCLQVLPLLEPGSVDAVVTDSPYEDMKGGTIIDHPGVAERVRVGWLDVAGDGPGPAAWMAAEIDRLRAELDGARQEAFRYGFVRDVDDPDDPDELQQADDLRTLVGWIAEAESTARRERDEAYTEVKRLKELIP